MTPETGARPARRPCAFLLAALPCAVAVACAGEDGPSPEGARAPRDEGPAAAPWFREEAGARGLVFEHASGHVERYLFPEIMGGGAALLDADQDGDLDAYLVQSGSLTVPESERSGNALFENTGGGKFRDASAANGADDKGYGMGVATGDADGDGAPDLYVTNVGPNALLVNAGGCRFRDATARAGVGDASWGTSAAFADLDLDGDLDLFVVNYIRWSIADDFPCQGPPHGATYCGPRRYDAPVPDTLYRNAGDGTFEDVTSAAGLRRAFGNGLGIVVADFDLDGRPDVFVANDGTPNQLWQNRGALSFEDQAFARGCAVDQDGVAKAGMGVSAADVDLDGDEDLLVVNLAGESDSYYRNDGSFFSDRTPLVGLSQPSRPYTRFGVALADFDDDGALDLYVANGRVVHPLGPFEGDPFAEPNLLFRGTGQGSFEEVLPRGGTGSPLAATSRGAAFGDVDGDGALDVLVVNKDAPAPMLINVHGSRGNWIAFRAVDEGRDALGARVTATVGDRTFVRTVRSAYSYCAASDPRVHLGLGDAREVDAVEVRWADGAIERFGGFESGRAVELARGRGGI
jgi:hypothetical protein